MSDSGQYKNSELKQLLTYIVNGETDRLQQSEWVEVAKKLLEELE